MPKVVAIGPYYHRHHCDKLKQTEKVKHVAAFCCIQQSRGSPVEELYGAVISAVDETCARELYGKDVMAGIGDNDFLPMMFYDACFLVMYAQAISSTWRAWSYAPPRISWVKR